MAIKIFTKNNNLQKGFTLVEMIVVVAIVGVISAMAMFNYSDFRQGIETRNLAEEMALTIRTAQSYATSSSKLYSVDSGNADNVVKSFGMVFTTLTTQIQNFPYAKSFMLYAALPNSYGVMAFNESSNTCNPSNGITLSTECLQNFSISTSASITNLETYTAADGWMSLADGSYLNIIFHRPTPDADICVPISTSSCGDPVSAARITITSQNGKIQKTITVWNTGQISVENVVIIKKKQIGKPVPKVLQLDTIQ